MGLELIGAAAGLRRLWSFAPNPLIKIEASLNPTVIKLIAAGSKAQLPPNANQSQWAALGPSETGDPGK